MADGNRGNTLIIGVVAAIIVAAAIGFFFVSNDEDLGNVIAKVDGEKIYRLEAEQRLRVLAAGKPGVTLDNLNEEAKKILAKEVATQKVLLKRARNSGVKGDNSVQKQIEEFSDKLIKQAYLVKVAKDSIPEEQVKQKYDELAKDLEGKKEVKASHILVKTKAEANEVIQEVKSKPFAQVAREKSLDAATAQNGGNLGYFIKGQMVKEFEDVAFKQKLGTVSEPVKTKFGWHVIKIEEKRPAQPAAFELVKDRIIQGMLPQKIQQIVDGLLQDANVELVDEQSSAATVVEPEVEASPAG